MTVTAKDVIVQFDSPDDRKEARGRNGWFRPHDALVWGGTSGLVFIDVNSKRSGHSSPITVGLPKSDALKLATAIRKVAGRE